MNDVTFPISPDREKEFIEECEKDPKVFIGCVMRIRGLDKKGKTLTAEIKWENNDDMVHIGKIVEKYKVSR